MPAGPPPWPGRWRAPKSCAPVDGANDLVRLLSIVQHEPRRRGEADLNADRSVADLDPVVGHERARGHVESRGREPLAERDQRRRDIDGLLTNRATKALVSERRLRSRFGQASPQEAIHCRL